MFCRNLSHFRSKILLIIEKIKNHIDSFQHIEQYLQYSQYSSSATRKFTYIIKKDLVLQQDKNLKEIYTKQKFKHEF